MAKLDDIGVGFKTARGDRPTALVVPETDAYGSQKLGMTRTLGDYYMQYHGATWEPAVSCIDLFELVAQVRARCVAHACTRACTHACARAHGRMGTWAPADAYGVLEPSRRSSTT